MNDSILRRLLTDNENSETDILVKNYHIRQVLSQNVFSNKFIKSICIKSKNGDIYWWEQENTRDSEHPLDKEKAQRRLDKAFDEVEKAYNGVAWLSSQANMKNEDTIEIMLTSLIELLKASLNKKSEYQTLEEEINYVKNYLILQKYRYEDRFKVEYDIDKQLNKCYILNFIFQPLVENALYHGIEMSKNNGVIILRALKEDNNIKLEVIDNGVGMDEKTIENIFLNQQKKIYPGLNSIGIKNINERIKLYFGEKYGLNFISTVGKGTKVEIILPYIVDISEVDKNDERYGC